jgi:hypothetical protein
MLDTWTDSITYVKSSDTVEENIEGVFLGGFMYNMDERDVEWLEKNNSIARGEGSSTSPVSGRSHVPSRNAKTRSKGGKEVTDRPSFVITETELELVMVLIEMFTGERCPYLHLVCLSIFIVHVVIVNALLGCQGTTITIRLRTFVRHTTSTLPVRLISNTELLSRSITSSSFGTSDIPPLEGAEDRTPRHRIIPQLNVCRQMGRPCR